MVFFDVDKYTRYEKKYNSWWQYSGNRVECKKKPEEIDYDNKTNRMNLSDGVYNYLFNSNKNAKQIL